MTRVITAGTQGPPGPPGATGPGATGATGPIGSDGSTGATGAQGTTGATGSQGDQGATGVAGADSTVPGSTGATGSMGPTGPQGYTGPQGATGPINDIVAWGDITGSIGDQTDLGDSATKDVGTTAGTVAAGDDSRFGVGGTSDHGALIGLRDDDHLQYLNRTDPVLSANPPSLTSLGPVTVTPTDSPFVEANGGAGEWDEYSVREQGAPIYDPVTDQWIFAFTGRNVDGASIGAVLSDDDGATWAEHPDNPLTGTPAPGGVNQGEDPYLVKNAATGELWRDSSDRALMFVEDKDYATQMGIGLWRSTANTLSGWTYFGHITTSGAPGSWDATDRDNPTVFWDGTQLVMLFEGRNLPGSQLAQVGVGFSADEGETWTFEDDPIIVKGAAGSWNVKGIGPDDILKVGDVWVLLTNGLPEDESSWAMGRFVTVDDPADWGADSFSEMPGNPIGNTGGQVMAFGGDPTRAVVTNNTAMFMAEISTPFSDLQDEVATNTGDISTNTGNISTNTGNISTLQGEMTTAEADIDDLKEAAGDWVRTDGQPNVVPLALAEVAAVGVRRVVTDSLIDVSGFDPGSTAWDGTSDLDPAGGVELVFDWGAPTPGQRSSVVWGLPVSAPGTEIIGLRVIGLASTGGGALTDVDIILAVSDGVTFAFPPGSLHLSADRSEVFLLLAEGLAVTDALNPGVAGMAGFLQLADTGVAPPTSITFDDIQVLERPTLATPAESVSYDNSTSGMTATEIQAAMDELEARVTVLEP